VGQTAVQPKPPAQYSEAPLHAARNRVPARTKARARRLWRHATLFCVTHDVAEMQAFERGLVIEGLRILAVMPPLAGVARGFAGG
jgi:hypothetical protein